MAYLGNSPQATTVLRLEARKSFALSVWVRDTNGRPLDISNTTLRIIMRKRLAPGSEQEDTALLGATAEIVDTIRAYY